METHGDEPVPLELGTVRNEGSDPDGHGSRTTAPWQRWVGLGAALLAGAVIGIVANNARNDAAEYGRVELVRGTVDVEFGSPLSSGAQTLAINLVNSGPREVEILDVEVDGFAAAGGDELESVSVEPGEWVRVQTMVEAECGRRPPGTLQVHVRTGSGEQTVVVAGQPGDDQLIWAWQTGCNTAAGTGVFIGDTRTVSADASGARIVLPVTNGEDQPLTITALDATTPGFAMQTDPLPIEIAPGDVVDVGTTWTVEDCAAAALFGDATVAVNVNHGDMETRVSQPLGNPTLIELVRLAVRVCET